MTLSLFLVIIPEKITTYTYGNAQLFIRIIGIICLAYVSISTLKTYLKRREATSLWFPVGFILLAISQLLLLSWYFKLEDIYLYGGFALRSAGLAVFLGVSYRIFYRSKEKGKDD
jgi:hypothetical protein